ncbi:uncharacterized protein Pyn_08217 [Prunus yedoensis var. nudiflora]|uniref:Ultraviolet-B receptor UVR8 n=1 Tax=Prunus yedoensis var. nudiflora TaxID=2094558 RepID=A0A314XS88_PRUYE|nr:uncharacterized protein Pyn_08217 [Prunus yedoensis var. nudiflora]
MIVSSADANYNWKVSHIANQKFIIVFLLMWFQLVCGGVLGHGPETKQCVTFTWINFSSPAHAVQVLASHNIDAFVMESGEKLRLKIQTSQLFRPKLVDALKGLPCKQLYTWGEGYCGALGHGDEIDKTTPELMNRLKSYLAVQVWLPKRLRIDAVCARKRKTFVLADIHSVYGCGWMGFGSLGFPDRGISDKILSLPILESLRAHHVSQISTGLYHTVALTSHGQIFGFGDNERAQLRHVTLRGCLEPTEIFVQEMADGVDLVPECL